MLWFIFSQICPICRENETTVLVTEEAFKKYNRGASVQEAFPELNDFDKEVLVSGMCYDCQSITFNKPKPSPPKGKKVGSCPICGRELYEGDSLYHQVILIVLLVIALTLWMN
jgi:hypothetical protein